ncbi:hypothetical protein DCS_07652 [Drechmeria coniospora]|uniref:Uncharacterized protein n=1 Tax=Drechmeria coniospora TaxID=98403 RepID=A0A151GF18_DRECN|nr:hypothetical protein DCS_07652 [Drechmeria coniospora]KYK55688.1 hypothetical protein DCS_07652 [Drechmeria coniospora]
MEVDTPRHESLVLMPAYSGLRPVDGEAQKVPSRFLFQLLPRRFPEAGEVKELAQASDQSQGVLQAMAPNLPHALILDPRSAWDEEELLLDVNETDLAAPGRILLGLGKVSTDLGRSFDHQAGPTIEGGPADGAVKVVHLKGHVAELYVSAGREVVEGPPHHRLGAVEAGDDKAQVDVVEPVGKGPLVVLDVLLHKGNVGHGRLALDGAEVGPDNLAPLVLLGWTARGGETEPPVKDEKQHCMLKVNKTISARVKLGRRSVSNTHRDDLALPALRVSSFILDRHPRSLNGQRTPSLGMKYAVLVSHGADDLQRATARTSFMIPLVGPAQFCNSIRGLDSISPVRNDLYETSSIHGVEWETLSPPYLDVVIGITCRIDLQHVSVNREGVLLGCHGRLQSTRGDDGVTAGNRWRLWQQSCTLALSTLWKEGRTGEQTTAPYEGLVGGPHNGRRQQVTADADAGTK